jgi:hypothetical protein
MSTAARSGRQRRSTEKKTGKAPKTETDFRRVLDDKDVDALLIATPDHWHAPMAILAAKAGKHVYRREALQPQPARRRDAGRGGSEVQAGRPDGQPAPFDRQRAADDPGAARGVIGNVFLANCFYARRRQPIGFGKKIAPPAELNWDLWQGPAPRTAYRDNLHPYNWHWFWHWGTGEALNNGTHLLDVARWGLNVKLPTQVNSFGGRWHDVGLDDWECPDTQEIQLEFEGGQGHHLVRPLDQHLWRTGLQGQWHHLPRQQGNARLRRRCQLHGLRPEQQTGQEGDLRAADRSGQQRRPGTW